MSRAQRWVWFINSGFQFVFYALPVSLKPKAPKARTEILEYARMLVLAVMYGDIRQDTIIYQTIL